jgi:hypothetical protein
MEAVVGFAGADVGRAVYFRDDERDLLELTPGAEHYDVVAADPVALQAQGRETGSASIHAGRRRGR